MPKHYSAATHLSPHLALIEVACHDPAGTPYPRRAAGDLEPRQGRYEAARSARVMLGDAYSSDTGRHQRRAGGRRR